MAEQSSKPATSVAEPEPARSREEDVPRGAGEAAEGRRTFTPWERFQIFVATWIGYFAVLLIGRTLRWEVVGWENFEAARQIGMLTIGFAGKDGGRTKDVAEYCLTVPSFSIHRIQEVHTTLLHVLWDMVHVMLGEEDII